MANGVRENEICPVFTAVTSDEPKPDPTEVAATGVGRRGNLSATRCSPVDRDGVDLVRRAGRRAARGSGALNVDIDTASPVPPYEQLRSGIA